jgi:methyl-galactoside transport system substrate-binding protein
MSRYLYKKIQNISPESLNFQHSGLKLTTLGIDGTDEGIEAVKNEEMLGTVYNDKEGQAREMLNLAFVIATDGDKSDIPLIDGKYVRTPYHKLTLENIEEYE